MGIKVNETNNKILTGRNSFCFQTFVTRANHLDDVINLIFWKNCSDFYRKILSRVVNKSRYQLKTLTKVEI